MADVRGNQDFVVRLTGKKHFTVGERTGLQRRVNANFIGPLAQGLKLLKLPMGEAETPILRGKAVAIGNPVRAVRQGVQMRLQFAPTKRLVYRDAIADDMQVAVAKIN